MKSVASVVLPVLALLAASGPPAFADPTSSSNEPQSASATPLPSFVPLSGQEKYASALRGNNGAAAPARQEAEKISALFAGMTTGSISKSDQAVSAEAAPAAGDPEKPILQESQRADGRSITLASTQSSEDTTEKTSAAPKKEGRLAKRAKRKDDAHRIPQKAIVGETPSSAITAQETPALASIGQKVSFIELLTNPALWHAK